MYTAFNSLITEGNISGNQKKNTANQQLMNQSKDTTENEDK